LLFLHFAAIFHFVIFVDWGRKNISRRRVP